MSYAVKEAFLTLQGEGRNAGRTAVFLRFTGCNLWSGREQDRGKGPGGCSAWCDTNFVGVDGDGGGRFDSAEKLAEHVDSLWEGQASRFVVCTGGEPLLQLDEALVDALHAKGFEIAVETNGTRPAPAGLDWICVSPKAGSVLILTKGHELKLVVPQEGLCPEMFESLDFNHFYLQPMDSSAKNDNTAWAIDYCKRHPRWMLSTQQHKLIGIR